MVRILGIDGVGRRGAFKKRLEVLLPAEEAASANKLHSLVDRTEIGRSLGRSCYEGL